ncbi:hypothetical protein N752_25580 [Desulforamulus aquiferis]|nr:hypothetical protein [Desulforamulus aquiferis]RYD02327.1 hypothetical protein N752_25580 [Desulforamulus aquiferis]
MEDIFGQGIVLGMLATGLRLATPYLLAALGEMFTQRSVFIIWVWKVLC